MASYISVVFLILCHNLSGAYIICIVITTAFIFMTLYVNFKISPAFLPLTILRTTL